VSISANEEPTIHVCTHPTANGEDTHIWHVEDLASAQETDSSNRRTVWAGPPMHSKQGKAQPHEKKVDPKFAEYTEQLSLDRFTSRCSARENLE
jgi:hypothetical protein